MTQFELEQELQRILDHNLITTLLQPIIDCGKGVVIGYEALSRGPSDSPLHSAYMLFETAERCDRVLELEWACLRAAFSRWQGLGVAQKLFVNISPDGLLVSNGIRDELEEIFSATGISRESVVIELSERYPATDLCGLKESLGWLKKQGFKIAIDDLGSGYSGLKLWSELRPDFVKIDRHFIRDIQEDLVKREFVRSIAQLSTSLGCKLIAEGVESEAEFTLVRNLDIRYLQGFYLGRPKPVPMASLERLQRPPRLTTELKGETAASMGYLVEPIAPTEKLGVALEQMQNNATLFALPVVENGRPVGLLHKWRLLELFSATFGRALYEKQPVSSKMSKDALVVEHDCDVREISRLLTDRDDDHYLKQHFIITRNDRYAGLGTTRALLKSITENRIEQARYANPLTQLPGNVPVQRELQRRLKDTRSFTLIYFDINHFKALNDTLGYAKGDVVIETLGRFLQEAFFDTETLVGHIGGDDFIVITHVDGVEDASAAVLERFNQYGAAAYPHEVQSKGYVETYDRKGAMCRFPLVSVAAAVIHISKPGAQTPASVSEYAARAKKAAKSQPDGLYILELPGSASGLSSSLTQLVESAKA